MNFKGLKNSKLLRLTPLDETSVIIADKIMNNRFYLSSSLEEIYFKDAIDWEYTHKNNMNSYLLYIHTLSVMSYLVNAYEITCNKKYLQKANEIIESWMEYEKSYKKNAMIWYDHTVAVRTYHIMYFYYIAKKEITLDNEKFESLIYRHIYYLYDDKNYFKNNHGIMMDKALIMCSKSIENNKSDNWCIKGISRLKETFYESFSLQGVHLENSVFYHNFVKNLYLEIEEFLNEYELSLGKEIVDKFIRINDYFNYVVKPNGELPLIGDSSRMKMKGVEKKYSPFIDYDAGIAILQDKSSIVEDSTWLSFVCGNYKKTHKHYDDLSFTLYSAGEDIFVDSGSFGYGRGKERRYVQSPMAHNTFMIKNTKYNLLESNEIYKKVRITDFTSNKFYQYVKGKNHSYEGIKLCRSIVLFNPDIIVLLDRAESDSINDYTQVFNIAKGLKVENLSEFGCNLTNSNITVNINQINTADEYSYHKGNKDLPRAVISEKTGTLTEISQVEFNKKGSKEELLTIISINGAEKKIKDIQFNKKTKQLSIEIDQITHNIIL